MLCICLDAYSWVLGAVVPPRYCHKPEPQCGLSVSADSLLLMQLYFLNLSSNHLVGPLPESWDNLTRVSQKCISVHL